CPPWDARHGVDADHPGYDRLQAGRSARLDRRSALLQTPGGAPGPPGGAMSMGSSVPTAGLGQELQRAVAEGTPDLHTVVSADGIYQFVSPAGAALFGWTPDDV